MTKKLSSVFVQAIALGFALLTYFGPTHVNAQNHTAEILWDSYGVPHVFADNMQDMYYSFGWSQMHNHANLILKLYGQARGRAAEYWGENYLHSDEEINLFGVAALAEKVYESQATEFRKYLIAFTEGINEYAKKYPDRLDDENLRVLPVTPQDVIAHSIRVIFLRFVAGDNIRMDWQRNSPLGSNSYAISPLRSVSKHALLVSNPHLPWANFFSFFEAQLQAPGFNAYGATLVGIPVLTIAFNAHLGWTHTVNSINASNVYELKTSGGGYLLDDSVVKFKQKRVVLKVRQADGSSKEHAMTFKYSKHGPVVREAGERAFAIRIAGMDYANLLFQWHNMAKAQNLEQFQAALKMMQLPMFNIIYADRAGNIFYLYNGNIPRRTQGNWAFWHGLINGRDSKLIWDKTLPYEDLPKVLNPKTGFLQNSNDPPWTCTYPGQLNPHDYPSYLAPSGLELRPQRAIDMVRNDFSIDLDKLTGYKLNTEMEAADRFLPDLLKAVSQYPDTEAIKAAAVLRMWDKRTDSGSRGGVLFANWFGRMNESMYTTQWDSSQPVQTPSGLKYPKEAVNLLAKASKQVISDYDSLNVPWGSVFRFRMNKLDYPANGGPGELGIFRTFYFQKDDDKKFHAVAGDSYVSVVEFGKKIKARVLLSYGNSSERTSKHLGDQLLLLSESKMRTAWYERKEILRHLEERELLFK